MNSPLNWLYKAKIQVTILVVFLIITIVPVAAGLTAYYFTTRRALENSSLRYLENLAVWESKLVRDWFGHQLSTVRMLANSPEVQSQDWARIDSILQRSKQYFPQFGDFTFVDTKGMIVYETEGFRGVNVSDRDYFKAAVLGQEYISELLVARTFKRPCIVFTVPVRAGGKIVGLLNGAVTVEALRNVMSFSVGKTGENFLIDRKGNFITIPMSVQKAGVNANTLIPAPKYLWTMKDNKYADGVLYYTDDNQEDIICVTKWLPDIGVFLVTKQDKSEALKDTGSWGLTMGLAAGTILLLLAIPMIWLIARRISRPLVAITTAVNEIASGKLSHRVVSVKANKEVDLLAKHINDMASNMEESMKIIEDQLTELESQKKLITEQNEDLLKAYDQLSQANECLQQLATTDQLTNICNRRCFMDRLQREVLVSLRSHRPLSIALIDIDHFKAVNDTYGHASGDQVLKKLVQIVSENIRRSDLLARFGGEEFVVLTPETNLEGSMTLAEKIRAAVERHAFEIGEGTIKITVSIGLAELNDFAGTPEKTEDQLILTADHYLYEAKRNGRNRVEGGLQPNTAN